MKDDLGSGSAIVGIELSGRQRALVEAFGHRTDLVNFYLGARRVLQDESNPDRLAQAAHSIRELLEKLPTYFDVPTVESSSSLKVEANNLSSQWERAIRNSDCHNDGRWEGPIDGPLRKFLRKSAEFFEWLKEQRPPRVEEARSFLRVTDRSPYSLPEQIERIRLQEWSLHRQYFVSVAHHGRAESRTEFDQWLYEFEDFLLKQLVPPTYEDREEIRRIVEEAEQSADS